MSVLLVLLYDVLSPEILLQLLGLVIALTILIIIVTVIWLVHLVKSELKSLHEVITSRTKAAGLTGVEQRGVFHDRIDKHFSLITVDAYRKLQGLEVDKLKTFSCLDQYLRMILAQLTHRESLRDIEVCLRAQKDKFVAQGYPGQCFQKRHGRRE